MHAVAAVVLHGADASAAGVTVLRTALGEDKPTLARSLRAAGYRTAVFGKMHFNRPSYEGMHGFDSLMVDGDVTRAWGEKVTPRPAPADIRTKPRWQPFRDPARIWLNAEKLPYPRYDDGMVGTFLARQGERFIEQDTLVVYMADHGYSLGQHGRFEKHCCYDPALRVPLIVRFPGRVRRGVVRDFTESVDVAPTILDLLGSPPLAVQHGRSLRPYLEGRRPAQARDHIFSQYLENEEACVRTARYKFIFCSGKRKRTDGYTTDNPVPGRYVRLYDLKRDPGEFTDVAQREPQVVARMQESMLERFRSTHPEAERLPSGLGVEESIEWFLRPRDA